MAKEALSPMMLQMKLLEQSQQMLKLQKANEMLLQRLDAMSPAPRPSPRRSPRHSPRQQKKNSVQQKNSVGNKRQAAESSSEESPSPVRMKRKLSFTPKRTPPPPAVQNLRKTLGDAIKDVYDDKILAGEYRDSQRRFKIDEFEDDVRPIIDELFKGDEVDTCGYTKHKIFRLAVDIVKKRDRYTPTPRSYYGILYF